MHKILLLTLGISLSILSSARASELLTEDLPNDFSSRSYRIELSTKWSLDGSEAASNLQRSSTTIQRLAYQTPQSWRVRREIPFVQNARQFWRNSDGLFSVSPLGKTSENLSENPDTLWKPVVFLPYEFAKRWNMSSTDSFSKWWGYVNELKDPETNSLGDKLEVLRSADKNFTVHMVGSFPHERTQVQVDLSWTYTAFEATQLKMGDPLL